MKKLFSERMGQPIPRVKEALDEPVRTALLQLIELRVERNSFGPVPFPVQCPDGHGNSGCDQQALRNNMAGYQVIWPGDARKGLDHKELSDIRKIFDPLQYAYEHVAQPIPGGYHSHFSHSHHDYDQEAGRKQLAEEVNRLFERNGIAFQLSATRGGAPSPFRLARNSDTDSVQYRGSSPERAVGHGAGEVAKSRS